MLRTVIACFLAAIVLLPATAGAQGRIPWRKNTEQAIAEAQRTGKLLLFHFWDNGCQPCILLERGVFNQPHVVRAMGSSYIPVKINVSENPEIAARLGVRQWPTDVILRFDGREVYRTVSSQDPNAYKRLLDEVAAHVHAGADRYVKNPEQRTSSPFVAGHQQSVTADGNQSQGDSRSSAFSPSGTRSSKGRERSFEENVTARNDARLSQPTTAGVFQQRVNSNPANESTADVYHRNSRIQNRLQAPLTRQSATPVPRYSQQIAAPSNSPAPPMRTGEAAGKESGRFSADGRNSAPSVAQTPSTTATQMPPRAPERRTLPQAAAAPRQPTENSFARRPNGAERQSGARPQTDPRAQLTNAAPPVAPRAAHPPLGLDGYCPVALAGLPGQDPQWKKGDAQFGIIHRDRLYLFCCENCLGRFKSAPDRYAPLLSGYDVVRFVETGKLEAGKREHGVAYRGHTFLFTDEVSLEQFSANRKGYFDRLMQLLANQE